MLISGDRNRTSCNFKTFGTFFNNLVFLIPFCLYAYSYKLIAIVIFIYNWIGLACTLCVIFSISAVDGGSVCGLAC